MERINYSDYFDSDSIFIEDEKGQIISYKEFWTKVEETKLPKTKFILLSSSSVELLIQYFAVISSGRIAVLTDPKAPQKYTEQITSGFTDISKIAAIENTDYTSLPNDINECSTIIFTSGSSGKPKPIMLSHKNLIKSALGTNEHYSIDSKSNWAATLPFFHVGGLLIVFRTLLARAKTTILDSSQIHNQIISRSDITHLSLVSTQLQRILERKEAIYSASKLKGIILGGAKTPIQFLKSAVKHGIYLSNSYGQTESCAQVLATPLTLDLSILQSVGKALPYRKVHIKEGRIIISGDTVAIGIHNGSTFRSIIETTDLAHIDSNGNFIIDGRSDDIFISGGENINPHEIDTALSKHDAINIATTFKVNDEKYGNKAYALIEVNSEQDSDDLKNFLKIELPSYKVPKVFLQTHNCEHFKKGIKLNKKLIEEMGESLSFFNSNGLSTFIMGDFSKPLLVVFHGFMGSHRDFKFIIDRFSNDFLIAIIDLPGHGNSIDHNFKHWSDFSQHLEEGLNSLEREVNLLGYSMGGRVALELAFKIKNLNSLTLESAGPGLILEDEKAKRLKQDKELFKLIRDQNDFDRFLDKWYAMNIFKGIKETSDYKSIINKKYECINGYQESLIFFSVAKQKDYRGYISEIASKTHFIFGHMDKKYTAFALELNERGVSIYGTSEASHNVHAYCKNKYIETLESILLK